MVMAQVPRRCTDTPSLCHHVYFIMIKLIILLSSLLTRIRADIWEQDLTSQIKIGLAETGYRRVDLRCGVNSFKVNVTLDDDFEGVVYTRGSFDNKTSSCFKNYKHGLPLENNAFLMQLEIPFDECKTVMDITDSRYRNTLIIQYDPDFIMPGDAAFALDCFFTPEFRMTTNVIIEPEYKSKITLVDADPSVDAEEQNEKYLRKSTSSDVSFFPLTENRKDEL